MSQPSSDPAAPANHGWDIAFTRFSRAVQPGIDACMQALTRQFEVTGLHCQSQVSQTPRGLSTFLSVVGRRGLLFIVDITVIDGMALAQVPAVALDIRLLDGCGDAVTQAVAPTFHAIGPALMAAADLARATTSVYLEALAHFDLLANSRPRSVQQQ